MAVLQIGGRPFSEDEVLEILVGYAFATEPLRMTPPDGPAYGTAPSCNVATFAYWSYDCVPASGGPIDERDLLVLGGIDGDLTSSRYLALRALAPAVSEALARIPRGTKFWDLPTGEIAPTTPVNSTGWYLYRAWWLLTSAHDIGLTITHKVLHHKRPELVPLIDRRTLTRLTKGRQWRQIHSELNAEPDAFARLEQCFEAIARERHGVPLTRLRIHDIALWCDVTGKRSSVGNRGRRLLEAAAV